ncbi:hypothetical protein BI347_00035 [Chromobacterium sphagni]|uniref:RNA polymerase sigma-70 domain-containing protein n=1 Tax=Chromobacterium sphagni TaxID=1903179 RepID=A0A1S1WYN0_9NEIS|nr:sigma-70 family RNA polymerase sigma factor [Chromobacterium sphagni]OHX12056.1 hypothetical protein BI347_00035 [Chromobacterium sphagni]
MEEGLLWSQFAQSRDPALRAALVECYQPLVRILAAGIYAKRVGEASEFADLYQSGMIGLLQAIDRFQPALGNKFKTFAERRIRGEILSHLEQASEVASQISARRQRLQDRSEAILDCQEEPFDMLFSLSIGFAISFMLDDTGMYHATETEAKQPSAYQAYALKQLQLDLRRLIASLARGEQQVLKLHYFNGVQFNDIAQILGISKGRVSQLHKDGLRKLRGCLGTLQNAEG